MDVYARRYPVTPVAARDRLTRYPVSNEPAVWWWTVLAPRGGRILPPAWVHSHRARYGGLLLVEGSYSPCSLAGLGPNCTGSGLATPPAGLAEARRALREAAGSSLVCEDDEQLAPSYVRLPEDPRSGTGGYYDRPGSLRCEPADPVLVVCLRNSRQRFPSSKVHSAGPLSCACRASELVCSSTAGYKDGEACSDEGESRRRWRRGEPD